MTQIYPLCRHNYHPIVFYLIFDTKPPSINLLSEGGFVSNQYGQAIRTYTDYGSFEE